MFFIISCNDKNDTVLSSMFYHIQHSLLCVRITYKKFDVPMLNQQVISLQILLLGNLSFTLAFQK